jgi:hypothetical protein
MLDLFEEEEMVDILSDVRSDFRPFFVHVFFHPSLWLTISYLFLFF